MQVLVQEKKASTIDCHVMNLLLKSPDTAAYPKVPWNITLNDHGQYTLYFFELKFHSTVAEYILWMI